MAERKAYRRYTAEFKIEVVETMRREELSYRETAQRFEIDHSRVMLWERIYLEEGSEGLCVERRGRASAASGTVKDRRPKSEKKEDEDLIGELQRLRAENAYLKKLRALIQEKEAQKKKRM